MALWQAAQRAELIPLADQICPKRQQGLSAGTYYTFNVQNHLARRGKNKQGRTNLRQVSYALVCAARGQWPLYYEVDEGNRNDSRQFGEMLGRFAAFYEGLAPAGTPPPKTTLVFDKGNNSAANFALIETLGLDYVGAVKLGEVAEWAGASNE